MGFDGSLWIDGPRPQVAGGTVAARVPQGERGRNSEGRGLGVLVDCGPRERTRHLVRRLLARGQGRADDTEAVVRTRLDVYRTQTEPLVARYRARRLLRDVDALGAVEEVEERTRRALALAGGVAR